MELFKVEEDAVSVQVYIHTILETKTIEKDVGKWLKNHINEEGIRVRHYKVKEVTTFKDLIKGKEQFYILIP